MNAAVIAAGLVFLAGLAMLVWRQGSKVPPRPQIPKVWPLLPRALVNSKERQIWTWLSEVLHDQQIMVKLPVTRFTIPAQQEGAEHWYNMLNRVYCTFTVCRLDGRVIGCVDVPGNAGLSMSNQTLKHGLLSQCGIPYWVVEPDNLPHRTQIRAAFLGETVIQPNASEPADSRMKDVVAHLQSIVSRQKKDRANRDQQGFEPTRPPDDTPMSEGWEQNSFMAPLDSRVGELRR